MGLFGGKNKDTTTTTAPAGLPDVPGYQAGTWTIDAVHSDAGFTVRHMAVSKVKGRFGEVTGTITTAPELKDSSVTAEIDVTSLTTFNEQRDGHVKSGDFFEIETHPKASFTSTSVSHDGDDFTVTGDLTIKGVTKPVTFAVEVSGFGPDAYGGTRAGFTATARINRKDFDIAFDAKMDNGGLVVSDNVDLTLEVEAVLNA